MKKDELILIALGVAVVWIVQQNRIYKDSVTKIANAAQPVGNLANTVNGYVPALADAAIGWLNSNS